MYIILRRAELRVTRKPFLSVKGPICLSADVDDRSHGCLFLRSADRRGCVGRRLIPKLGVLILVEE